MKLIPIYEVGSNRVIGWENRTSPDEIRSALSKRKPLFHIVYSTSFYSKRVKYVHIMYGTYTLFTMTQEFWKCAQSSHSFYTVVLHRVRLSYNNIIL